MKLERELMRGAGPAAVLRLLEGGERYGYELVELLDRRTGGVLAMGQSTLYPMLYNLEAKALVASRVQTADNGRPRRYYRLTDKGRRKLAKDRVQWQALSTAPGSRRRPRDRVTSIPRAPEAPDVHPGLRPLRRDFSGQRPFPAPDGSGSMPRRSATWSSAGSPPGWTGPPAWPPPSCRPTCRPSSRPSSAAPACGGSNGRPWPTS